MSTPEPLQQLASDPGASPSMLFELASSYPELRPLIAKNPRAYPDLLIWLGNLGDPAVDAALQERNSPLRQTTTVVLPAAPVAPTRVSLFPAAAKPIPVAPIYLPPAQIFQPAQPVPSYVPSMPTQKRQNQTNRGLIVAFIFLGVLALVAAGIALYLLLGSSGANTSPQSIPTPSDTGMTAPTESPSPSVTAIPFPAPATAASVSNFASPSGNIACRIGSQSTVCTISENSYQEKGYADCGSTPVSFVIDSGGSRISCEETPVVSAGAATLPYDTSSSVGDFACTSTDMGMSCWNTITGDSVAFARDGWMMNTEGQIPQNQFSWQ